MKLTDLLGYDDIVIQCHDKPDADTIASGYALLKYLKKQGKSPRLVYTGGQRVTRGSLHRMIEKFGIPLTYLDGKDEKNEAELLITVDCRAGERNVTALPHKSLAVIDHHTVKDGEKLPELCEIRTEEDGYASCATVLWALLEESGYSVKMDTQLPTILYYGLYMDTQELKNIQRMDKDMQESLKYDADIVSELQSVNLSLREIQITGRAYNNLHINPAYHFAVAEVERCDPDILGIVSDELMKVAEVEVGAAYCMLEDGVKVSVRCRGKKNRTDDGKQENKEEKKLYNAAELIGWLVRDMGSDGGGSPTKAAGRIPEAFLAEACAGDGWDDLSGAAGRLIYKKLTDYFESPPKKLRSEDIGTMEDFIERAREFCGAEAALYRKKKVPVGYARSTDLFPEGEEILLRMLEGDVRKKVTPELYIMIGVDGETYHNDESTLHKNYDLTDEPFHVNSANPWQPKIYRYADRAEKLLAPYAKKCAAKDGAMILAAPLKGRTRVLTKWGEWHHGESGDWLVSQKRNPEDIYIIRKSIFERTYEKTEERGQL